LKGSTAGNRSGGSLGPEGWTVTKRTDRIWYSIPRLVSGSIKFTVTNVSLATNLTLADNEFLGMYDAGYGISEPIKYSYYRTNYYKAMIRVYGTAETSRPGKLKLIWGICNGGSPGYGACPCADAFLKEPFGGNATWNGSPVTLEVTWGGNRARLLI
jgi:hypothetical protein